MSDRILIAGAGFAGLWSALGAARLVAKAGRPDGSIEVALLAPAPVLNLRPRFHEACLADMSTPLTPLLDAVGVRFIQGQIERIHTRENSVEATGAAGNRFSVAYDRLVLATPAAGSIGRSYRACASTLSASTKLRRSVPSTSTSSAWRLCPTLPRVTPSSWSVEVSPGSKSLLRSPSGCARYGAIPLRSTSL